MVNPGGFDCAWGRRRFSGTSKYRIFSVKSAGDVIGRASVALTSKLVSTSEFRTSKQIRASEKNFQYPSLFSVIIKYRFLFLLQLVAPPTSSLHAININNVRLFYTLKFHDERIYFRALAQITVGSPPKTKQLTSSKNHQQHKLGTYSNISTIIFMRHWNLRAMSMVNTPFPVSCGFRYVKKPTLIFGFYSNFHDNKIFIYNVGCYLVLVGVKEDRMRLPLTAGY